MNEYCGNGVCLNRRCRLLRDNGCKSADLIGLIKFLLWGLATQRLQRNQTLPIFAKGVACKTIFYDEPNRNKPIVEKAWHIYNTVLFSILILQLMHRSRGCNWE